MLIGKKETIIRQTEHDLITHAEGRDLSGATREVIIVRQPGNVSHQGYFNHYETPDGISWATSGNEYTGEFAVENLPALLDGSYWTDDAI